MIPKSPLNDVTNNYNVVLTSNKSNTVECPSKQALKTIITDSYIVLSVESGKIKLCNYDATFSSKEPLKNIIYSQNLALDWQSTKPQQFVLRQFSLQLIVNIQNNQLILKISKIPGMVATAKKNSYLFKFDGQLILEELYAKAILVNGALQVIYSQTIFAKEITIDSNSLQATTGAKLIAETKCRINSTWVDNRSASINTPNLQIHTKILFNTKGKIIARNMELSSFLIDNHNGIISTSKVNFAKLNLELLQEYMQNRLSLDGGSLGIQVHKLINTGGGIILAKENLGLSSLGFTLSRRLSLYVNKREISLINQGMIVSLRASLQIGMIHRILNLNGALLGAKTEVHLNSLSRVFKDPKSIILSRKTYIDGILLAVSDLQPEDLNLRAYSKINATNLAVKNRLTMAVIKGDGIYKDVSCQGKATIVHGGDVTLERWQANVIVALGFGIKAMQLEAKQLNFTMHDLEYTEDSFKTNNLHLHFLAPFITRSAFTVPAITFKGLQLTLAAPITANNFTAQVALLHHSSGEIKTQLANFDCHNIINDEKIIAESLTVEVKARFFNTKLNLLQANNYNLQVTTIADLYLPAIIAGNYIGVVNSDARETFQLLYDVKTGGDFKLSLQNQSWEQGSPDRYVQILSLGKQELIATAVDLVNGAWLSQSGISLEGQEKFMIGRLATTKQTPSNISSLGETIFKSHAPIYFNGIDLYSGGNLVVTTPEKVENISSTVDCAQDAYLDTPLFFNRMPYKTGIAPNPPRPLAATGKCWNYTTSYAESTFAEGEPAWMFVHGKLICTGKISNIASSLFYGELNGPYPEQINVFEAHNWNSSFMHGHKKPHKRWPYNYQQITGQKTFQATSMCHKDNNLSLKAVPECIQEGVFITAGRLELAVNKLQIGTLQNVNLNIAATVFTPIIKLMDLYVRPNFLFDLAKKPENSSSVFNPKLMVNYQAIQIPIVVVTKEGFRIGPREVRKLYHDLQESQLIIKGLVKKLGHSILGDGFDRQGLHNYLLANAHKFFNNHDSKAIGWGALQAQAEQLTESMLVYKEMLFNFSEGEQELVLEPYLVISPKDFDADLTSGVGGIWAKFIKLTGHDDSSIRLTGFLKSKQALHLDVDQLDLSRRQYTQKVEVATVTCSKSLTNSKRRVSYHKVITRESQPGAKIAAQEIVINSRTVNTSAAEFVAGVDGITINADTISDSPNIDISLQSYSTEGRSILKSQSISGQIACHTVVPTVINSTGPVRIIASKKAKFIATNIHGKSITIGAGKLLDLSPAIIHEELAPNITKKGQALFTTTGYIERGVPVVLDATEGVYLKSGAQIELHAPLIKTRDLKIIAKEVLLAAVKLKQELFKQGKGLTSWNTYVTKYSEHLLQENALCPRLNADFIEIMATQGNVILESLQILANLNEQTICQITASVDVLLKTVKLKTEHTIESQSFSLNLKGPPVVDALVNGSVKPLINNLALIANIKDLAQAKTEGEAMGHSLMAAYNAYDLYKKYQQGDLFNHFRDQLLNVGVALKQEHKKTQEHSTMPILSLIQVGKLLIKAGENIELEGVQSSLKQLFIECNNLRIKAAVATHSKDERNKASSLGINSSLANLKTGLIGSVGLEVSSTHIDATNYINSTINAEQFTALIKNDAEFKGVIINAAEAFVEVGNQLLIETLQDSLKVTTASYNLNLGYGGGSGFCVGGAVSRAIQNKKWSEVQSGIFASHTLYINVGGRTTLTGAVVAVDKDAAKITAELNGEFKEFYEFKIPSDGDCAFHALGVPRLLAVEQLLANCDNLEIRRLIAQEFDYLWIEASNAVNYDPNHAAVVIISGLPSDLKTIIEQFYNYHKVKTDLLNKLKDDLNDRYRPEKRLDAMGLLTQLAEVSMQYGVTEEEQRQLIELAVDVQTAREDLLQFLSNLENCELFIKHCIAHPEFWPGFDEQKPNPGIMEALAIINKFNFRIWANQEGVIKVIYSPAKFNLASEEYKELYFTGNHYNLLHTEPGIFQSPMIESQELINDDTRKTTAFGIQNLSLGRFFSSAEPKKTDHNFSLGAIASAKQSGAALRQVNNPSILGNIAVAGQIVGQINHDASYAQGAVIEKYTGFYLPVATGIIEDIAMQHKSEQRLKFRAKVQAKQVLEPEVDIEQDDVAEQDEVAGDAAVAEITPKMAQRIIDQYDLQLPIDDNWEDNDEDPNSENNFDRAIKFGRGFVTGSAFNTAMTVASRLPIAGPGILMAGAGATAWWGINAVAEFEYDNFILTEDYREIMQNPLVSHERKTQISEDAHFRYEQAAQARDSAGILNQVKGMWKESPEQLGRTAGLFFGFGGVLKSRTSKGARSTTARIKKDHGYENVPPNFKESLDVSSSKSRVTSQPQATSSSHNASSVNAQVNLSKKLSALETAQKNAVKTESFSDGRIRYYTKERPATKIGPTRGSSYVTEYNPDTGQIRSWIENYSHDGNVNRVHPKMLNGQDLEAQHYPPTQTELNSFTKKPGGPK